MYKAIIVYNHFTKDLLGNLNDHVHVIGGGVHLEDFTYTPLPEKEPGAPIIIFMSGRADDPTKGLDILQAAGKRLWRERQDFRSGHDQVGDKRYPWFKALGWHDIAKIRILLT